MAKVKACIACLKMYSGEPKVGPPIVLYMGLHVPKINASLEVMIIILALFAYIFTLKRK